ncbi:MAG TPA: BTAD domain-containing putative transcriptional regulator [Marmoricola sp.]|nr:BTAD domain-containing putative transcriptional regulator [Marmoricola sp.]
MATALTLLDGVRWNGEPVVGDRAQALLAALAASPRAVRAEQLVAEVWGDDVPANPAKALQVLVSRTRTACGPEAVVREGDGYRLGLATDAVDALLLLDRARAARAALDSDADAAGRLAAEAIALAPVTSAATAGEGPLAELRRDVDDALDDARSIKASADSRTGAHALAFPVLAAAWADRPGDEALLVDLLRSEAAVSGAGAALERFEQYRSALADRLGVDPGPELQRLHAELLALDSPVREGVHYEATTLVGRDEDVRRLHGLLSSSRVVSILGPGGLGKTRLAHVIGRQHPAPTVHFVELVGVTVGEDLVGEVGSALGVRDSVSGRRALTTEQRADVRARIAQHLDASPALLILDNCEHIIAAVADLVAYLVATTRGLRVLTTTRAPLAISAERVYALGELSTDDAIALFEQRAEAARPDVALDRDAVEEVVSRLDGLPLAIELAAAKVRVMSVADIARRLTNRFALLRGGDRSAPDRHQTLLAVIDWSWNLLAERERRALRWLSVFHDGFTLAAAEAVLGPEALDAVQDLADQSLLTVVDVPGGVRYRMLETVREFGRMQLVDAGEDQVAQKAHRDWAVAYAGMHTNALMGPGQFAAVDALRAEDNNLADVLRQALAAPDPDTVVQILAALGTFWMILGDHPRIFVLTEAVADAVRDWMPAPAIAEAARIAIAMTVNNAIIGNNASGEELRDHLRRLGPGDGDPRVAALVTVMSDFDAADTAGFLVSLEKHAQSTDRFLAVGALQWRSHALENNGDPLAALESAERALELTEPADGPWMQAILHTQVAQLAMQVGRRPLAVVHAGAALPVLDRLGAFDDAVSMRALLALSAIAAGDLVGARAEIERLDGIEETESIFGARLIIDLGVAELALAEGDIEAGLAGYRAAVTRIRELRLPGLPEMDLEPPWVIFAEGTALAAYARYAPDDVDYGPKAFAAALERVDRVLDPDYSYLDFPNCGVALFALGSWGLYAGAMAERDAVRLLVLAERFAFNRGVPTMDWDRTATHVEELVPGLLAEIQAELDDLRGPDLLAETRAFVASL